jgi:hypothetical protein
VAKIERSSGPVVIDRKLHAARVTSNIAPDKDLGGQHRLGDV